MFDFFRKLTPQQKLFKAFEDNLSENEIIKLIKKYQFDANAVDPKTGKTLLILACENNLSQKNHYSFHLQKALLEKGADPLFAPQGKTPPYILNIENGYFNADMFKDVDLKALRFNNYTLLTYITAQQYSSLLNPMPLVEAIVALEPQLLMIKDDKGNLPADVVFYQSPFYNDFRHLYAEFFAQKGLIDKDKAFDYVVNALKDHDNDNIKAVVSLLKNVKDFDFSRKDQNGDSLLHIWARDMCDYPGFSTNEARSVYRLLKEHIDINTENNFLQTPLMLALDKGYYQVQVEGTTKEDSCLISRKYFIDTLLNDPDIDITKKDADGNTALHYSVSKGMLSFNEKLVELGADIDEKNNQGVSPRDIARKRLEAKRFEYLQALCQKVKDKTPIPLSLMKERFSYKLK